MQSKNRIQFVDGPSNKAKVLAQSHRRYPYNEARKEEIERKLVSDAFIIVLGDRTLIRVVDRVPLRHTKTTCTI